MKKQTRLSNRKLLDEIKECPCVACGAPFSDPDHIKTRGAGGDDIPENLWPLCRTCHNLKGQKGLVYLTEKFPHLADELKKRKWYFDDFFGKWRLPKLDL